MQRNESSGSNLNKEVNGIMDNIEEVKKIPCRLCGQDTPMLGTKLCDGCWELETRIKLDPELAKKILSQLFESKGKPPLLSDERIKGLCVKWLAWDEPVGQEDLKLVKHLFQTQRDNDWKWFKGSE